MEPSYGRLPVRRVLATAGIGVVAVGLSVAGALPVMAASGGNGNSNGNSSHSSNSGNGNSNGNGGSSGHNPPGNNGTVFIHDVAGDHSPHNVPHVGCTFYVDFFGFDSGQVLSTHFVGQAPTGKDVPLPDGDWTGTMPNNNASGAGNDFDWEQPFTLDTSVLGAPQPQQGYHVKLTVSTGEPGGVKHKVFWIAPCQSSTSSSSTSSTSSTTSTATVSATSTHTSTTTTTTSTTQTATVIGTSTSTSTSSSSSASSTAPVSSTSTSSSSSTPETVVVSGTTTSSAAEVLGEQFHHPGNNGGTPTQVLGETFHKAPTSTSRALPFTGAPVGQLLLMGLMTVATGALLVLGFRRRGRHAR